MDNAAGKRDLYCMRFGAKVAVMPEVGVEHRNVRGRVQSY